VGRSAVLEESLRRRLSELAGINALGIVLASTHDPGRLVELGLAEIVGRLGFERGAVGLVDAAASVIGPFCVAGGPPGLGMLVGDLAVPLDDAAAVPAILARADGPLHVRDAASDGGPVNTRLVAALGSPGLVGTPLVTQGRVVGVLLVADARDGRPLEPEDGPLLYTVGSLLAGGLESARLHAALEAQNRALEARVADRTRDLLEAMTEAQEARAAAELANEAKSRFLANVSHELRTPLTSVVGFARLNRKRLDEVVFPVVAPGDPKVDRAVRQVGDTLGIIVEEGDRLTTLINDLLDLAKIEAGRIDWRMAPLQLEDVVRRAIAATSALFEVGGVALETDIGDGLPAVTGDAERVLQVVINLLSNAVKFSPGGRVTVRVARDGGAVRVAVADTGRGIEPADIERIFEPFRQASDTVPDGPRGTGLGLPIARQIVRAHGGDLLVDSRPGEGSTFWFAVPLPEADGPDRTGPQ
jgi:signal transduction histidine kinase